MTVGDLQRYVDPPHHARQRGVHSPPYRQRAVLPPGNLRSSPERLSLLDALRDPEVNATLTQSRAPLRSRDHPHSNGGNQDSGTPSYDDHHHADQGIRDASPCSSSGPFEEDLGEAQVTFLSDEDVGPEDVSPQHVLDFRRQRLRLMRRRYEIEHWDHDDRRFGIDNENVNAEGDQNAAILDRLNALISRSRGDDKPHAEESHDEPFPTGVGVEKDMKDDRVTCVRFRIRTTKHKVAIKFDPPVSGRFILLKMWAGRSNVDVQSVIAKGYGSLRFFPAKEFR